MFKEETAELLTVGNRIGKLEAELDLLKQKINKNETEDSINIICFSGEWDKLFASLSIANGALALGREVHLFFTFWAISALQNENKKDSSNKSFLQKTISRFLPCGYAKARLSRFNMLGLGKLCIKKIMKQTGIDNIDTLYNDVVELGAHIHVCETSAQLFGIDCKELKGSEIIDRCGVTTLLSNSLKGKITLFI